MKIGASISKEKDRSEKIKKVMRSNTDPGPCILSTLELETHKRIF